MPGTLSLPSCRDSTGCRRHERAGPPDAGILAAQHREETAMASLRPARPAAGVPHALFAATAVALTLCACSSPPGPVDPAAACSALAAPIDAAAIALPTRGATIETT